MLRRTLLLLALSAFAVGANDARAQTPANDAIAAVNAFAQKGIVDVLQAQIPKAEKTGRFRTLFKQYFDVPAIARFTAGRFWRGAQPTDQDKFIAAFEDVIVYTWSRRFSEYNGQTLKTESSTPDGDNGAFVNSVIASTEARPIAVTWRLRKRDDSWKIVDITIEGVSMAQSYRQEYASIVTQQGGFPALVTQLQNQASSLAKQQ